MNKIFEIIRVLHKCKAGPVSREEKEILDDWMEEPGNRKFTEELLTDKREKTVLKEFRKYDPDRAYQQFLNRNPLFLPQRKIWWSAAVITLLVGVTTFSLYIDKLPKSSVEGKLAEAAKGDRREEAKAILTLAGGEKVVLGKENSHFRKTTVEGSISSNSSGLIYEKKIQQPEQLVYNELYVPRRGEFNLRLDDGSRIYINADSYLKYPQFFGKDSREVELSGEAYFEIEPDPLRPFIVKVGGMKVQVLGTKFNINAYKENPEVKTTLVSGKVEVDYEHMALELMPGEQGCVRVESGEIYKKKVNVAVYTTWKDGLFKFEKENLENIMMILARWYDVNVFFRNDALKYSLFSGDLKKYDTIEQHLRMLEMTTNISFVVQENNVFVGYKN